MTAMDSAVLGNGLKSTRKSAEIWGLLRAQAEEMMSASSLLKADLLALVLNQSTFDTALAALLAQAVKSSAPDSVNLFAEFKAVLERNPDIAEYAAIDLEKLDAVNPACPDLLTGFLSFRGFQALQVYRITHALWVEDKHQLAAMIQNWSAIKYGIDIHPAARVGKAVFIDHGMGLVVGSTAVLEDDVNIWHGVTLGSTLTQAGDRHPKIRKGATICAGATILGNIEVGAGAIVAASSVVLKSVGAGKVVAGVPAREIGVAPERLDAIDADFKSTSTQAQKR